MSHIPAAADQFIFRGLGFALIWTCVEGTGTADPCISNVEISNAVSVSLASGNECTYGQFIFN